MALEDEELELEEEEEDDELLLDDEELELEDEEEDELLLLEDEDELEDELDELLLDDEELLEEEDEDMGMQVGSYRRFRIESGEGMATPRDKAQKGAKKADAPAGNGLTLEPPPEKQESKPGWAGSINHGMELRVSWLGYRLHDQSHARQEKNRNPRAHQIICVFGISMKVKYA